MFTIVALYHFTRFENHFDLREPLQKKCNEYRRFNEHDRIPQNSDEFGDISHITQKSAIFSATALVACDFSRHVVKIMQ